VCFVVCACCASSTCLFVVVMFVLMLCYVCCFDDSHGLVWLVIGSVGISVTGYVFTLMDVVMCVAFAKYVLAVFVLVLLHSDVMPALLSVCNDCVLIPTVAHDTLMHARVAADRKVIPTHHAKLITNYPESRSTNRSMNRRNG